MSRHAILVGFPAEDWRGPALVRWEPGLVENDYLALRAQGENGENGAAARWVGCRLGEIEQARYCDVTGGTPSPCFQTEMMLRSVGTLHAYASESCLHYLREQGVVVAEMEGEQVDACRALWNELCKADETLPDEVCDLVNATLA